MTHRGPFQPRTVCNSVFYSVKTSLSPLSDSGIAPTCALLLPPFPDDPLHRLELLSRDLLAAGGWAIADQSPSVRVMWGHLAGVPSREEPGASEQRAGALPCLAGGLVWALPDA